MLLGTIVAVLLDKPIYLLVKRGTSVPENLRRLAWGMEEFSAEDDVGIAGRRLLDKTQQR